MAVQEVVEILRQYNVDDGEALQKRVGPEAVAAALGMQRFLAARLEEDRLHASLWEQFLAAPRDDAEELTGVLEALTEADPAMARRLDAFVGEYHAVLTERGEAVEPEDKAVAAIGGDVLDTAVGIEEVPAEEGSAPYTPDSEVDTAYDQGAGAQPTYLYGNARSGDDDVGREVGVDRFGEGAASVRPAVTATTQVAQLFAQLRDALSEHVGIDAGREKDVAQLLDHIQEAVVREEADLLLLVDRLETLQQQAPDVAAILLEALVEDRTELAPKVRRAVMTVYEAEA